MNWDFSSLTSCPTGGGERLLCRGYTKFDFTVDEGNERLNLSREKNQPSTRPQREGGEILCDLPPVCVTSPGASTSNSVTSRINGMTTRTHTT